MIFNLYLNSHCFLLPYFSSAIIPYPTDICYRSMRLSGQVLRSPSLWHKKLLYALREPNSVQQLALGKRPSSSATLWPTTLTDISRDRLVNLRAQSGELYPRISSSDVQISCNEFASRFRHWEPSTENEEDQKFSVNGKFEDHIGDLD